MGETQEEFGEVWRKGKRIFFWGVGVFMGDVEKIGERGLWDVCCVLHCPSLEVL